MRAPRHIEVQLLGDGSGAVTHLFDRYESRITRTPNRRARARKHAQSYAQKRTPSRARTHPCPPAHRDVQVPRMCTLAHARTHAHTLIWSAIIGGSLARKPSSVQRLLPAAPLSEDGGSGACSLPPASSACEAHCCCLCSWHQCAVARGCYCRVPRRGPYARRVRIRVHRGQPTPAGARSREGICRLG